jgi:flavin reductase ActVB
MSTTAAYRAALADHPAGVVLVTATGAAGDWRGFTASSFCGVSLRPPIVSACLAESAECYAAFRGAEYFCVSFLGAGHEDLARRFATRGADKFGGAVFAVDPHACPYPGDARWVLSCRKIASHPVGDHEVLYGEVVGIGNEGTAGDPLVYWQRRFSRTVA